MNGLITIKEAAERFGLTRRAIYYRIYRGTLGSVTEQPHRWSRRWIDPNDLANWRPQPRPLRGPQYHLRGKNWHQTQAMHKEGFTNAEIARELGLSRERVRQLVNKG